MRATALCKLACKQCGGSHGKDCEANTGVFIIKKNDIRAVNDMSTLWKSAAAPRGGSALQECEERRNSGGGAGEAR